MIPLTINYKFSGEPLKDTGKQQRFTNPVTQRTRRLDKSISPFMSATGGTETTDGDYKIHTFTSSGTFIVITPGDVSVLLVGGGGSASGYAGSTTDPDPSVSVFMNGAGGGEVKDLNLNVSAGTHNIVVGKGGNAKISTGVPGFSDPGDNGGVTYFGAEASANGGYGGDGVSLRAASSGNGNLGGLMVKPGSNWGGGGGGGNGGVGGDYSTWPVFGGTGGAGTQSTITGNVYGAGGGGTGGYGGYDPDSSAGRGSHGNWRNLSSAGQDGIVVIKYKFQ